jgi:FMN phosphatase YigB (HAD superfamily)
MLLAYPPERIALLNSLKGRYRLFLFSNTNALHYEEVDRIHRRQFNHALNDHFEKAYYSHLIGLRKPELAAFQHVLDDAGIAAHETLFIDDLLKNIEGAKAAGLHGAHVPPGTSILDLEL